MKRFSCLFGLSVLAVSPGLFAQTTSTVQPVAVTTVSFANPTGIIAQPAILPIHPDNSAPLTRLQNLSTRARVTPGSPLITGFAINGTVSRPMLIRAAGPALTSFGVAGALAAPRLRVHAANGTVIAENIGWGGSDALNAAFAAAGAFPFAPDSADSAVTAALAPGVYTVEVVDSKGGNGGVTLAEVYDLGGATDDSRLVNVSTRATVATGGGELISGFVLTGTAPVQLLLRGIGPGLLQFGVTGVLAAPVLTVYDSTGLVVAANNLWSGFPPVLVANDPIPVGFASTVTPVTPDDVAAVIAASSAAGAFPLVLYSYDAALVTTLPPGAYTVQVTGSDRILVTTPASSASGTPSPLSSISFFPSNPGVALLEIYQMP